MSSPFDRLPDVLAQLLMQCLSLHELLQFARCNRRLLSQADSAFAFKCVPPMTRVWSVAQPVRGMDKLMRHVAITLKPSVKSPELPTLLAALSSMRLYGFDTSDALIHSGDCCKLLDHPAMHSLRQLTLDNPASRGSWTQLPIFTAIARLPALHTLTVLALDSDWVPPGIEALRRLQSSVSLTSLQFHDSDDRGPSRPSSQHLTVRQPWIYDAEWVRLFASPGLRKLISLTFDWCNFTGPTGGASRPVSSAHAQLSSLHLKMPFGVDLILPSVRFASALRTLRIEANCDPLERVLPSFAV